MCGTAHTEANTLTKILYHYIHLTLTNDGFKIICVATQNRRDMEFGLFQLSNFDCTDDFITPLLQMTNLAGNAVTNLHLINDSGYMFPDEVGLRTKGRATCWNGELLYQLILIGFCTGLFIFNRDVLTSHIYIYHLYHHHCQTECLSNFVFIFNGVFGCSFPSGLLS